MFVQLEDLGCPLVKVDTLDLGDVDLQLPVLAGAPQAHECPERDGRPARGPRVAI